jgi:hypothetical protein
MHGFLGWKINFGPSGENIPILTRPDINLLFIEFDKTQVGDLLIL